jgi:hypothetical protein
MDMAKEPEFSTLYLKGAFINPATALIVDGKYGPIEARKLLGLVVFKESSRDGLYLLARPFVLVRTGQWINQAELSRLKNLQAFCQHRATA